MKTTVDVPESELQQLLVYTQAKTKREAIVHAIREFNRRKRLAELTGILGTFEEFVDADELEKMREQG